MPLSTINTLGQNGEISVDSLGNLITKTTPNQLAYGDSLANIVVQDPAQVAVVANTDLNYKVMKTFTAAKQGPLRVRFDAYILSGTYYFAYRIRKNYTDTIATGYFASNLDGAAASVHSYRPFTMVTSEVFPGDVITVEMVSSNGSGVPVVGTSAQTFYMRNLRVSSTDPDVTFSNAVGYYYVPLSVPLTWTSTFTGTPSGSFNVTTQWGLPTGVKALSVIGYYHVTGYSSGWNDHTLSQFGPRAQGGGTPWSFNTSTDTEWGSYTLFHDGDSSGAINYYGYWSDGGTIIVGANDTVYYRLGYGNSGGTHYNSLWIWGYWI